MKPGPGNYAGVVSRGAAFVVDSTIVVVVCTVGFQFTVAIASTIGLANGSLDGVGKALGYVIAIPVVFGLYCAGAWTLVGRTAGMMLLGLRVVKADGSPPGARRSIVRALAYWVSAILMIGFLWIAVDRRHQGFHDKLARTFVVYDAAGD